MAHVFTSTVISAPIDQVWEHIRDFNGLPAWNPGVVESHLAADPPTISEDVDCMQIVQTFRGVGREHTTLAVLREDKLVGTITRYELIWAMYNYFKGADEQTLTMYLSALREKGEVPF